MKASSSWKGSREKFPKEKSVLSNKIGHHHGDWQQSCSNRTDLRSDRPSLVGRRQLHRPCIHLSHTSSVHTPIWTIFDAVQSFRAFAQRTVFIDNIALTGWGTNQIRSAAAHQWPITSILAFLGIFGVARIPIQIKCILNKYSCYIYGGSGQATTSENIINIWN